MVEIIDAQISQAQREFLEMMPGIQGRAAATFRHLDPAVREEAVADTVALSWKNFLHCLAEHKPVAAASLSHYALLAVKSGRTLCGQSSTDVLARRTLLLGRAHVQNLNAFRTAGLPTGADDGWWDGSEALVDKRTWERPLERVRIKHDYGVFLALQGVTPQERRVFNLIAENYRTGEIARRMGVSAPRVCQIKGALARKLREFLGPGVEPEGHALRRGSQRRMACGTAPI